MLKAILESPRGRRGLTWQIDESNYHKSKAQPNKLSTKTNDSSSWSTLSDAMALTCENDPLVTMAVLHSQFKIQQAAYDKDEWKCAGIC